jgi:hypothetical protein
VNQLTPFHCRLVNSTLTCAVKRGFIPPAHFLTYAKYLTFNKEAIFETVYPITFFKNVERAKQPWADIRNTYAIHLFSTELSFSFHCSPCVHYIFEDLLREQLVLHRELRDFIRYMRNDHTFQKACLDYLFDADVRPDFKRKFALEFHILS